MNVKQKPFWRSTNLKCKDNIGSASSRFSPLFNEFTPVIGNLTHNYCIPLLMSKRLTSYILHYRSQYAFLVVLIHRQLSNVAPIWKANTFSFRFTFCAADYSRDVRSKKVKFSMQCYMKAVCPNCFLTIENSIVWLQHVLKVKRNRNRYLFWSQSQCN